MGTTTRYEAKSGDWLAKIAQEHGTTVGAIWNHPENAGHRAKRGSPDVLYPGDVLIIPTSLPGGGPPPSKPPTPPPATPPELPPWPFPPPQLPKPASMPTWACPGGTCVCHPPAGEADTTTHTIVFHDPHGVRMPGARCMVYDRGRALTTETTAADALGELTVELPPTTRTLAVAWTQPDLAQSAPFEKRYFVDVEEHPVRSRLVNLGFSANQTLADNIRDYQRAHGQDATGREEDIYEDLRSRHDEGRLTPFARPPTVERPPATGDDTLASFFERPERVDGLSMKGGTLMGFADSKAKSAPEGGKPSGADKQGAVVPGVGQLLLVVGLEPTGEPLKVDDITVRLLPQVVPGLLPDEQRELTKPRFSGITWEGLPATYAVFFFDGVRAGSYTAIAHLDNLQEVSRRYALGHVDVSIKVGLGSLSYLPLLRERPILHLNDPLLELDVEVMQRRRKVLATVFEFLPQSAARTTAPANMPPYQQGAYKDMLPGLDQTNTCAPINVLLMNRAGAIGSNFGFNQVRVTKRPDGTLKQTVPSCFTEFAPGLAPSVGDCFLLVEGNGQFHHCGVVVKSSPRFDDLWLTADGGQPDRTSPFERRGDTWRRFYEPPPSREGAYVVPRSFYQYEGAARLGNRFIFPTSPGYGGANIVRGWTDVTHPTVFFKQSGYTGDVTEEDFRGLQERLPAVYQRVLEDIEACKAEEIYSEI